MMKLTFQGGGPLDGERFVSERAAETRFRAERGGWYELSKTIAGEDGDDWPTAVYEWALGSDLIARLQARLNWAGGTASGH